MDAHDQILLFLKATGPTIPSKVAKTIGSSILIASAHLSDLTSRNKIKISFLKVGGSPLYFLEGQEDQLFQFAKDNLNVKDYDVLENLKGQRVLRENELDLLSKVALRQLKDFAIPLQVRSPAGAEFFWKWHLLSAQEASAIISDILKPKVEEKVEEEILEIPKEEVIPEVVEEIKEDTESKDSDSSAAPAELVAEEVKVEAPVEEPVLVELSEPEKEVESVIKGTPVEEPVPEVEEIKELETPKPVEKVEPVIEKVIEPEVKKTEELVKEVKEEPKESKEEVKEKLTSNAELETWVDEPKKKTRGRKVSVEDKFLPAIETFLKNLNIKIDQKETIRKNKEMDFVLRVPSIVGEVTYFCKAKSKARCDEKDLSTAYMESRIKKLPLLFLYTKDLNKKAQEMLESDAFQNALVKKIE
ncbi:hypothetical protein HOD05_00620 [Candidatus Woesearchaeota archaeon]|nr:hypothetical protein [Candidatus Woesearchaeota archaeon]MBT4150911.1 hypothetical protein [Candidatus Woesearchaeota archaeon]MBT4247545.1 hypothetical protein [Candidatus Woesearchaeota archaeon]MBT4433701.1 hypothetical protein [Candidatus Woesearchaeota archaeon]MBT7332088.1 hypothetical protein [Candidatus Woesearchaeota archaeon]